MIEKTFYLSDTSNLKLAEQLTDLSLDEIEYIVGRFAKHSSRAGNLRGEVVLYVNGKIIIRHHFTKKLLWRKDA